MFGAVNAPPQRMPQRIDKRVTETCDEGHLRALGPRETPTFAHAEIPNPKSRIPNPNICTILIWDLGFGIWDLLHAIVLRTSAVLGRHPGDHLVRIHDVARLAVNAVGRVDLQARRAVGLVRDFIDVRGTEPRARMPVLRAADRA